MKKTLLKIAFVTIITLLAWFKLQAAILAVCAAIIVALYDKLGSLIELSFGPLRAKLEKNLSDSEKVVEKLRLYAAVQAKDAISASVHTGRFASGTDWIFVNAKRVESGLRELGLGEDEIAESRKELVSLTLRDLGSAAIGQGRLPMHLEEQARIDWHELNRSDALSNPDAIAFYLEKWGELSTARAQLIDDMRWIQEHGDIKDREQYMRAHRAIEWPQ